MKHYHAMVTSIDETILPKPEVLRKYDDGYLNAFETGSQMRAGIGKWLTYYNSERPHSTHGILTPDEAYDSKTEPMKLAA